MEGKRKACDKSDRNVSFRGRNLQNGEEKIARFEVFLVRQFSRLFPTAELLLYFFLFLTKSGSYRMFTDEENFHIEFRQKSIFFFVRKKFSQTSNNENFPRNTLLE